VSPGFPGREGSVGQEGGEATLQSVGAAADRVRGVAVVTAFAVEAQVAGRTDEEGLEQLAVGDLINFRRHVEGPTAHRHRSAKSQEPASQQATTFQRRVVGTVKSVRSPLPYSP